MVTPQNECQALCPCDEEAIDELGAFEAGTVHQDMQIASETTSGDDCPDNCPDCHCSTGQAACVLTRLEINSGICPFEQWLPTYSQKPKGTRLDIFRPPQTIC